MLPIVIGSPGGCLVFIMKTMQSRTRPAASAQPAEPGRGKWLSAALIASCCRAYAMARAHGLQALRRDECLAAAAVSLPKLNRDPLADFDHDHWNDVDMAVIA